MQVFMIRHPQPDVAAGICYGQTDLSLREDAMTTARQLLPRLPVNAPLFSSPLQRCRLLAEALSEEQYGVSVFDHRIQEMHFGEWEMQQWSAIPRQQIDSWVLDPLHYVVPEGESVIQVKNRLMEFISEQKSLGTSTMILITHAGIIKILYGYVRQLPVEEWMRFNVGYGELLVLEI